MQPRAINMILLEPIPLFQKTLKQFLVKFVHEYSSHWIPLHWPATNIIEGKHSSIADLLHNWKQEMRSWTIQPPQSCECSVLLGKYPDLPNKSGHIAGSFSSAFLPAHIQSLANTCIKDGCYPAKAVFIANSLRAFNKWLPNALL